jgi:hypothetical protein
VGKLWQQQQQQAALGRKMDFALPRLCTVKPSPGSCRPRRAREEKKKKKKKEEEEEEEEEEKRGSLLLTRPRLSSYLYRPYTTRVNLSMLLRAADRYANMLWKHCLLLPTYLRGKGRLYAHLAYLAA